MHNQDISGLQLVPAIIRGKNDELYNYYWIANIYVDYRLLDEEKSEHGDIDEDGYWSMIRTMVLDESKIVDILLENILVFGVLEDGVSVFYHKSIVDSIMSVNPIGVRFVPISDWSR